MQRTRLSALWAATWCRDACHAVSSGPAPCTSSYEPLEAARRTTDLALSVRMEVRRWQTFSRSLRCSVSMTSALNKSQKSFHRRRSPENMGSSSFSLEWWMRGAGETGSVDSCELTEDSSFERTSWSKGPP